MTIKKANKSLRTIADVRAAYLAELSLLRRRYAKLFKDALMQEEIQYEPSAK